MKNNKVFALLIYAATIVVLGLTLVICVYSRQEQLMEAHTQTDGEQVEISITFATGDGIWNTALEQMTDAFMEEHPEIKVTLQTGATDTQTGMYTDYLKRETALNHLGDIVEIRDKQLFDGTGLMAPLPEELTELVQCEAAEDGNIYVLPENIATQGIIYNKELFEKLELTEPQNMEEFYQICEKLMKYRLTPIVVGAKDQWHLGFWINHFFRTDVLSKEPDWQNKCKAGEVSWTDEEPRQMMDSLLTLFEGGYINPDYESVSDSETGLLMAEGNVGMLYSGPWMFQKIQEMNSEISLGWFYLPDEEGNVYAFIDKNSGWGITESCKENPEKYEAAVTFLTYFFTSEQYQKLCSYTNSIPSTNETVDLSDNPVLNEVEEKMNQSNVTMFEQQIGSWDTPANFRSFMFEQFLSLLRGEKTTEEYLELMETEWEKSQAAEGVTP